MIENGTFDLIDAVRCESIECRAFSSGEFRDDAEETNITGL